MSPTDYTLDDLVQATGFSKRQIRFYITKKLVPGAGDSRGPHAVYGEETLQRLRLLGVLKETRIEPTGRTMTLDEIGHALDTLSADGIEALLAGRAELTILDTDSGRREPLGSATDYLESVRRDWSGTVESRSRSETPGPVCREEAFPPAFGGGIVDEYLVMDEQALPCIFKMMRSVEGGDTTNDEDDLSDLLGRLQALLAELAADSRFTDQATGHPQWLRVTTPDLEFHVRKPDDHPARARLARMAQALARLLEREE